MAKKSNAWREEPWWYWDWPGRPTQRLQGGNMAHVMAEGGWDASTLKAAIYLPDPDSQTGWQLHKVYGDPPTPPPKRRMGFDGT